MRQPFRVNGSTKLTSTSGLWPILLMVPGDRISPKAIVRLSKTTNVPLGDTDGLPPEVTEATNPSLTREIQSMADVLSIILNSKVLCHHGNMFWPHFATPTNSRCTHCSPCFSKIQILLRAKISSGFQKIHCRVDAVKI